MVKLEDLPISEECKKVLFRFQGETIHIPKRTKAQVKAQKDLDARILRMIAQGYYGPQIAKETGATIAHIYYLKRVKVKAVRR